MTLESELKAEASRTGRRPSAFAVVNARSGGCTVADVRAAIEQHLHQAAVAVHEVAEGDDVGELVRAAVGRGCDPIIAAGGDGTVSTVADALVGSRAHLVVLPLGTANVFARELGIPVHLGDACQLGAGHLALGSLEGAVHRVVEVDALRVAGRHYLTQIGVGIDALMIRDTATEHKKRFGRLAYLWSAARQLVGFQPRKFRITVDGRPKDYRASQVLVANTGMMGQPPLRWGPDISPRDGMADLCVVRVKSLFAYAGIFWHVVTGRHQQNPNVRYAKASHSITIATRKPLPVQADGEIIGDTPITIEVAKHALRVVIPAAQA